MTQHVRRNAGRAHRAPVRAFCVSAASAALWGAAGLGLCGFKAQLNRPVVQETVEPGQRITGQIEVENQGSEPLDLDVYVEDWEYLEGGSGDKDFLPPGTSPWSASNWIHYFPNRLSVPPRGKAAVEYTVTVPPEASGGHYAVMFFESFLASGEAKEGVTVQYTGRLGSLFEIDTPPVRRTGEITGIEVSPVDPARPLVLRYTFRNTGNVVIRPKAYYNILDINGRYLGRGEFEPLYTSPGRSGAVSTEWTGSLPPGTHTLLLTVDLGGGEPLVVEHPFSADAGG
jgi:hypothetical protein